MGLITHIEQLNGQNVKARSVLKCDRTGCHSEVEWNAMPGPTDTLPRNLDSVVEINSPKHGTKLMLCSVECAIIALNEGLHLPPKIALATSDEAKAAVAGAEKVRELKVKK